MKILVTGGAGYVGSFAIKKLLKEGHKVVVFDNLENGHREVISRLGVKLIKGDLRYQKEIAAALDPSFEAVMHFAAFIESGESMEDPLRFFENNTGGGINLLKAMQNLKIQKLIFSSTAGVYGEAEKMPITENSPVKPTSYYCWSKYFLEEVVKSVSVYGIKSVILRYFNAAGAALDGSMGEDHRPETHLIPMVIKTALGQRKKFFIFGDDYPTKDGTCIRDYVHVEDLATAHLLALKKLSEKGFGWEIYNVGIGKGYSVKEVVEMVKKVSGVDFPVEITKRRPGDWAEAYADASKIQKELGWQPKYGLKEIIKSAHQWHKKHPQGNKTL